MTRTISFIHDDQRRVYALKVTIKVECELHLLAHNEYDARQQAQVVDLANYFAFNKDNLGTDDEGLLTIRNATASVSCPVDLRALPVDTFPPNNHPDFIGHGKPWRR
jgi:hypothetical protein